MASAGKASNREDGKSVAPLCCTQVVPSSLRGMQVGAGGGVCPELVLFSPYSGESNGNHNYLCWEY